MQVGGLFTWGYRAVYRDPCITTNSGYIGEYKGAGLKTPPACLK